MPAPPAHTDPAPGPAARALLAIRRRCYPLIRRLRRSRLAVKWWFGVRLPPGATVDYDTTTLALRRSLARWGRGVGSALEVGTGQAALLALYVARRFDLPVDAVDVSAARVASSRRAAELNRLAVRVWRSDLFAAVEGRYELIFSNPPYVPTATGRALGLTAGAGFDGDQVWDGGPDGTAVIGRLLAGAPERLLPGGVLLLGVQAFYVPDDAIRRLARGAGFEVASRERTPPLPSVVWVLRKG